MRCSCCPSLPRMLVGTAGEHCVWQWTFEGWTGQEFCMSIILYIHCEQVDDDFRCFVISWRFPLLPATELETHMRSRRVCAASMGCLHRGKQQPCSECLSYPSGHAMPPHDRHEVVWNYGTLTNSIKFNVESMFDLSCSQRSHISRLENDISLGQSLPFWGGCWYTSRFLGPRGIWRLFALESSRYPMSSRKWRGARTQMPGGAEPQMRWRREAMENVEAKPETSRDGWKMMCFFVSMFIYRRVTINHQPNWCV